MNAANKQTDMHKGIFQEEVRCCQAAQWPCRGTLHGCAFPEVPVLHGTAHALMSHLPCDVPAACIECDMGRRAPVSCVHQVLDVSCRPRLCPLLPWRTSINCPRALETRLAAHLFPILCQERHLMVLIVQLMKHCLDGPLELLLGSLVFMPRPAVPAISALFQDAPAGQHCRVSLSGGAPAFVSRPLRQPSEHFLTMPSMAALQGSHVRSAILLPVCFQSQCSLMMSHRPQRHILHDLLHGPPVLSQGLSQRRTVRKEAIICTAEPCLTHSLCCAADRQAHPAQHHLHASGPPGLHLAQGRLRQ